MHRRTGLSLTGVNFTNDAAEFVDCDGRLEVTSRTHHTPVATSVMRSSFRASHRPHRVRTGSRPSSCSRLKPCAVPASLEDRRASDNKGAATFKMLDFGIIARRRDGRWLRYAFLAKLTTVMAGTIELCSKSGRRGRLSCRYAARGYQRTAYRFTKALIESCLDLYLG